MMTVLEALVAFPREREIITETFQCMEEGTGKIPSMPEDFHVAFTTPTSVHLQWEKNAYENINVTNYKVFYTEVFGDIPPTPLNYTMVCVHSGVSPTDLWSLEILSRMGQCRKIATRIDLLSESIIVCRT